MTEQHHPITPPLELVQQWYEAVFGAGEWPGVYDLEMIATELENHQ